MCCKWCSGHHRKWLVITCSCQFIADLFVEWKRIKPTLVDILKEEEKKQLKRANDEAIVVTVNRSEFEGKRVSRSMFKAMSK